MDLPPIHMRIPFLLPHSQTELLRNRTPRPPTPPPGAWRPRHTPREERARMRMLEVGWDSGYCVAGPVFSGFEPTSNVIRHREAADREAKKLRKLERERQAAMAARGGHNNSTSSARRAGSATQGTRRSVSPRNTSNSRGRPASGTQQHSKREHPTPHRRPVAAHHPSEEQLQRELDQHIEASRLRREEERRLQEKARLDRVANAGTLLRANFNGGQQSPPAPPKKPTTSTTTHSSSQRKPSATIPVSSTAEQTAAAEQKPALQQAPHEQKPAPTAKPEPKPVEETGTPRPPPPAPRPASTPAVAAAADEPPRRTSDPAAAGAAAAAQEEEISGPGAAEATALDEPTDVAPAAASAAAEKGGGEEDEL